MEAKREQGRVDRQDDRKRFVSDWRARDSKDLAKDCWLLGRQMACVDDCKNKEEASDAAQAGSALARNRTAVAIRHRQTKARIAVQAPSTQP